MLLHLEINQRARVHFQNWPVIAVMNERVKYLVQGLLLYFQLTGLHDPPAFYFICRWVVNGNLEMLKKEVHAWLMRMSADITWRTEAETVGRELHGLRYRQFE